MPARLTAVADLERVDHYHLPPYAKCFFWGEYTPYEHTGGKKWNYSATNQLISNLKKKLDRKALADWRYKMAAIEEAAQMFARSWQWRELLQQYRIALIPMPPSKDRTDPMFDPRMTEIVHRVRSLAGQPLDVRDCLSFKGLKEASHEAVERPTPDDLFEAIEIDPVAARVQAQPGLIFLFDDMLTTGAHFVAAQRRLEIHFPGVEVVGQFVARRIIPCPFEDAGEDLI